MSELTVFISDSSVSSEIVNDAMDVSFTFENMTVEPDGMIFIRNGEDEVKAYVNKTLKPNLDQYVHRDKREEISSFAEDEKKKMSETGEHLKENLAQHSIMLGNQLQEEEERLSRLLLSEKDKLSSEINSLSQTSLREIEQKKAEVSDLEQSARQFSEKSQAWATETNKEVVAGQGYGAKYYADKASLSANTASSSAEEAKRKSAEAKASADRAVWGNIGDIKYTIRQDVPAGGALCDGAEYTREQFPDFFNLLKSHKLQFTDYQTFNNCVSGLGYCPLPAFDERSGKFKVPRLENVYIKSGIGCAGYTCDETLPNITGNIQSSYATGNSGTGCVKGNPTGGNFGAYANVYWREGRIDFNASWSNGVYGRVAPEDNGVARVNPKHVIYRAYIILYSKSVPASTLQAQQLMTGLDSRVNQDAGNLSPQGKAVIAGIAQPSANKSILSLGKSGVCYQAPKSGYFQIVAKSVSPSGSIALYNKTSDIGISLTQGEGGSPLLMAYVPVGKGQEVVLEYKDIDTSDVLVAFNYLVGETS